MSKASTGHRGLFTLNSVFMATACLVMMFTVIVAVTMTTANMTPKFNTTTEHLTVVEGGRATLPCTVESIGDQSVIWINPKKTVLSVGDRRLIDDHRISIERPYIKIWNLLIRNVRYSDTGNYECRINTKPIQTKAVYLDVKVPPSIVSEMSSDKIVLEEGQKAMLVCNVTGIPQPNVTWFKRNQRTANNFKEKIYKEGEILFIHNITRHCDDVYECYVDNGVPPAVSKAIRVVVNYPPEVVIPHPRRLGQYVGKETILDCQIYANPLAVTNWMKDGKVLTKNEKYDIDVLNNDVDSSVTLALRIRDLTTSDFGKYECTGENFLGEDKGEKILYEVMTTTTPTSPRTTALQEFMSINRQTDRPIYDNHQSAKLNVPPAIDHKHRIGGSVDDPPAPGKGSEPARSKSTSSIGSDGYWRNNTSLPPFAHSLLYFLPWIIAIIFH